MNRFLLKDAQNGQHSSPAQPERAETRLVPGKAAGRLRTEAYPLGYVARRRPTENEVEDRFQHPSVLENFRFRVPHIRTKLRLRVPFIEHQQVTHRDHPDNLTCLCDTKMPHA
jgi:hypothetical protein